MEFNSKELQESFNISKDSIINQKQAMDNVSKDIRTLEKFLLENSPNTSFKYIIDSVRSILWDTFGRQGPRLIFQAKESINNEECFKPLIECKFITRQEIYPFLPKILVSFSKELGKSEN